MSDHFEREPMANPTQTARAPTCSFCAAPLRHTFVDLGLSPLCESFVEAERLSEPELFYPLHAYVCGECLLVQVPPAVKPEHIFTEYAYFSSYSDSWVDHMRRYAATVAERLGLGAQSLVVEVGSNDGYLLQHFAARGIPVLGVEPAANIARVARERGIPTCNAFFDDALARTLVAEGQRADLICGANVLAQVPKPNEFIRGLELLLKPGGVVTIEFPHLLRLIEGNQFDTIYHEHFSYFSFLAAERMFAAHGLVLFDVEELPTHGGSLRIWARRASDQGRPATERVSALRAQELSAGFTSLSTYGGFGERVHQTRRKLLEYLFAARRANKRIAAYGAPGKGNTLLNACGIRADLIEFTVDRNPYKHGRFLPGSRIPIYPPEAIRERRPDVVLVLPWNLADEIAAQLADLTARGVELVVPIPEVRVIAGAAGRPA